MKTLLFICFLLIALTTFADTTRDPHQVTLFRKGHACPSTGKFTGACPNYLVDHIIPLCLGGVDEPRNMQWQERSVSYLKDNLEREACAKLNKVCPKV